MDDTSKISLLRNHDRPLIKKIKVQTKTTSIGFTFAKWLIYKT